MTKKLSGLNIATEFLQSIAGPHAIEIVKVYEKSNKAITDEEIEKKVKLKITEIRTILNQLHYRGIAEYNKKRNEKTGWYIYTWEIKIGRITNLLLIQQLEKVKKMQVRLEFEQNYSFFACKKKCGDIVFEVAAEYQFKCPQCGQTMSPIDGKKQLKNTKNELEEALREIKLLEEIKEAH